MITNKPVINELLLLLISAIWLQPQPSYLVLSDAIFAILDPM